MAKYIIEGNLPLKGQISLLGAKNVGFKLLIASLLADSPSEIDNIPKVKDVFGVMEIIESLGGKAEFIGEHKVKIDPTGINIHNISESFGEKNRSTTLFVGPLVARFGKAFVPMPGGDLIGKRPINWHLQGFEELGLNIKKEDTGISVEGELKANRYRFEKNTHTGTESLIIAAAKAPGDTVIENAALEPEVDDLINFLNKMGAKIIREHRVVRIKGVQKLEGTNFSIMPDRNEAVTFACSALVTGGEVEIIGTNRDHLQAFEEVLTQTGADFEFTDKSLIIRQQEISQLLPTDVITAPHPGFMTDWHPIWAMVMTQADGDSTIHEAVFESRFAYVDSLKKMGANIEYQDLKVENPESFYNFEWNDKAKENKHSIKISGPTPLKGQELEVTDIRAGATLLLAALAAKGTTVLNDTEHIERGYENLEVRLRSLGANIQKTT